MFATLRQRIVPLARSRFAIGVGAAIAVASTVPAVHLETRDYAARLKPRAPVGIKTVPQEDDAEDNEEAAEDGEEGGPSESAYDERTGEINWDCPCLGGMAHGPCGEEFKQAFSCFVFSEADPKGIDCVDKFKLMQDCFRRNPEVYADEIAADDAADADIKTEGASESD